MAIRGQKHHKNPHKEKNRREQKERKNINEILYNHETRTRSQKKKKIINIRKINVMSNVQKPMANSKQIKKKKMRKKIIFL